MHPMERNSSLFNTASSTSLGQRALVNPKLAPFNAKRQDVADLFKANLGNIQFFNDLVNNPAALQALKKEFNCEDVYEHKVSTFDDPRFIYHALGPDYGSDLSGWSLAESSAYMAKCLEAFISESGELSEEMKHKLEAFKQDLGRAKEQDINLNVGPQDLEKQVLGLANKGPDHRVLFFGGHSGKGSSGGGHAVLYEVTCQPNGKYSFMINNTGEGNKTHVHGENGRVNQIVYKDLDASDLNAEFWKRIIETKHHDRVSNMDDFYKYVDKQLNKENGNKCVGREIKAQRGGVCAWKTCCTLLHGIISPGETKSIRNPADELVFVKFKKFIFEKQLKAFSSVKTIDSTIRLPKGGAWKVIFLALKLLKVNITHKIFDHTFLSFMFVTLKKEQAATFLKADLEGKILKMNDKIQQLEEKNSSHLITKSR